ncbi:GNAT family N-acetyltransferase [Hephaestia sp. MAHUQ-44]|nr:GNAT family N-acetyltransferase [Hephaestia sp. MAHUQ-44]
MHGVRDARDADRKQVAAMLARAFADDPGMRFIFPDPAVRARRMPRLFGLLYKGDGPVGMRLMTAGGEAATLWRAPGQARTGSLTFVREAIPMLHALGGAVGRALRVANAIEAHQPDGCFWYLHIAGCDPAAQGQGFGGAAVRAGIARAAGARLPVYLETPLEKNIGFYQGLGFAITGEWRVPGGGPRFWSMLRPA